MMAAARAEMRSMLRILSPSAQSSSSHDCQSGYSAWKFSRVLGQRGQLSPCFSFWVTGTADVAGTSEPLNGARGFRCQVGCGGWKAECLSADEPSECQRTAATAKLAMIKGNRVFIE